MTYWKSHNHWPQSGMRMLLHVPRNCTVIHEWPAFFLSIRCKEKHLLVLRGKGNLPPPTPPRKARTAFPSFHHLPAFLYVCCLSLVPAASCPAGKDNHQLHMELLASVPGSSVILSEGMASPSSSFHGSQGRKPCQVPCGLHALQQCSDRVFPKQI